MRKEDSLTLTKNRVLGDWWCPCQVSEPRCVNSEGWSKLQTPLSRLSASQWHCLLSSFFFFSLFLSSLLPICLLSFFFFLSLFLANEYNHIRFLYFKITNATCRKFNQYEKQNKTVAWNLITINTLVKGSPGIHDCTAHAHTHSHTHTHTLTHSHTLLLTLETRFSTYALMERKSRNLERSHLFQCRSVTSLTVCITVYYESNNSQVRRWAIPLPSKYLLSWIKTNKINHFKHSGNLPKA